MSAIAAADQAVIARRLHSQLGKSEDHTGKDVDADLLVHAACARLTMAKDPVAAKQARHETMHALLFAAVDALQRQHTALVQQRELGEVRGMLPCGFVDELDLLLHGAGPEQEDHDQRVREADFGAVDEAIADGFDEHERVVVLGIEDDVLLY